MKKNYSIKLGLSALAFLAQAELSAQQTYTFTNAGASGRFGPTQTQVNNAYQSTNLQGSVTVNAGIQQFTATPGVYRITAFGAQGGFQSTSPGGLGAAMQGEFTLTTTSTLNILVGQQGELYTANTGGGGGTFVWVTGQAQPLIVAGGGGGSGYGVAGVNASTNTAGTNGTGAAGTPGTGGNGANPGGGGWLTDGANYNSGVSCAVKCSGNALGVTVGGASPTTTILYHGCAGTSDTGDGGFGGGSGGAGNCTSSHGGGGGGGYSGGVGQSGSSAGGGGGGSFNAGSNQVNTAGANTGHGRVIIEELCSVKISSSSSGTVNPALLCSGNSLTLTTDAVSNFSWSTGQTTSSIIVAPTSNTVYSVIGTSSMNCTASGIMNVLVSPGLPALSISNPSSNICLGQSVSVTATGAVTYTWTNPGVVNGQTFTPNSTAVYTVSGENGCGVSTATTMITVAPLPVTAQASPTLICQGYPSTITAVSAVSGYTWQGGPVTQTGSIAIFNPTINTVYTVTASDGICSGTQTVLLTTKTTPTIATSQTLTNICEGQSVNLSASGAGAGGTYSWSTGGSGTSITLTPPSSTNVIVIGTNSLNCSSTALQIILVDQAPALTISADKNPVCAGDQVVLTGSGADTYQWTSGPATAAYTINPTSSINVYTVTGSHTVNPCTASETIAIAAVVPTVTLSSALSVCEGGSVTFTASGATTYTWNGVNTGGNGVFQVSPLVTTVYTLVSTTSSMNVNCQRTDQATVTVHPNPTITVTPAKELICRGETHTLTASGAVTYSWDVPATGSVITVKPNTNIIYEVTGVDANGCESTTLYTAKVSQCSGISETAGLNKIAVYPNPSNGEFVVSAAVDITLGIMNSVGQEVRTIRLSAGNHYTVEVKDLSSGVYFIVGQDAEGKKVSEKIVITR